MINLLEKFERAVNLSLILMLFVVITLSVVDISWQLVEDMMAPPLFRISPDDLLKIFGMFLLVLVGLELLETVRRFYLDGEIHLQVIFTVALLALGRKIIILEPAKYDGLTLIGLGVIVIALVGGYVFVHSRSPVLWRRAVRSEPDDG